MKFKLDENLGIRTREIFKNDGYEARTVRDQGMQGCSDRRLYEKCCSEEACLVTLDLDFSDVVRFPPDKTSGIVVIRPPRNPNFVLIEKLVQDFPKALKQIPIKNDLWIVEPGRIRIHESGLDQ